MRFRQGRVGPANVFDRRSGEGGRQVERGIRLFIVASVTALVAAGIAIAAVSMHFNSPMEGAQEAPVPRDTLARGNAVYQLSNDGTRGEHKGIVANIEN